MNERRVMGRTEGAQDSVGAPSARRDDTQGSAQRGESATPRVVDSNALLAGQSQLAILHNQTIYFLRQTRLGKLILTK